MRRYNYSRGIYEMQQPCTFFLINIIDDFSPPKTIWPI